MQNPCLITFSAHLAHLLNTPDADGWVRVEPGALLVHLHDILGRGHAGDYRIEILGAHLMGLNGAPEDLEEAAQRWIDDVLDRPLQIRAGRGLHRGHQLLESLVRRAPGAAAPLWIRGEPPPGSGPLPEDLRRTAASLEAEVGRRKDPSKPPLWLQVGGALLPVPQGLSLWGAIQAVPSRMRLIEAKPEEDEFVHRMIAALEAANVSWGRAVVLRLLPHRHGLTTNQIKSLHAFVNNAGGRLHPKPDRAILERAWEEGTVTKFSSLDDLLESPVGRALCGPPQEPSLESFDEDESLAVDEVQPLDLTLDPETLKLHADEILEMETLEERQKKLALAVLLDGHDLTTIWGEFWARRAFRSFDELKAHTDIVIEKLLRRKLRPSDASPETPE